MTEEIKVNQRWQHITLGYTVKVLAIAEGYVMCRRKGCLPFLESVKYFYIKYRLNPQIKPTNQ